MKVKYQKSSYKKAEIDSLKYKDRIIKKKELINLF